MQELLTRQVTGKQPEGRNGPPDTDLLLQEGKGNNKFPKDNDWPKWEQTTQDLWLELTGGRVESKI